MPCRKTGGSRFEHKPFVSPRASRSPPSKLEFERRRAGGSHFIGFSGNSMTSIFLEGHDRAIDRALQGEMTFRVRFVRVLPVIERRFAVDLDGDLVADRR